ncbi:MAG: hypothetical protein KDK23_12625 [Leptospiraceae bacterium]|nr:hypothetical protein [Leptospiraceae bacterium]
MQHYSRPARRYKVWAAFLFSILTLGTATLVSAPSDAGLLNQRELAFLFRCALLKEDPEWMWATKDDNIQVGEKILGEFLGGAQHIRYSGLPECINTYASYASSEAPDIFSGLSSLSGIPVYQDKQGEQHFREDINYYNPKLIVWLRNLIPEPSITFAPGTDFQRLYDVSLKRNARILAFAYLEMKNKGKYKELLQQYRDASDEARVDMKHYLLEDSQLNDHYASETFDQYSWNFDAGHAAAFWLRRGLDDTHEEVFGLIQAVFAKYDKEALKKLK